MNNNIFREYDIRGIVAEDFDTETVNSLGKAFGTVLHKKGLSQVSVSGDIRHTTNKLKNDFINGLIHVGIDVYDIGILPTPINYFSLFNTNVSSSVQITGSHNPPEYNGFKFSLNKKPFYGSLIQELKDIIINKRYIYSENEGSCSKVDIVPKYLDYLQKNIKIQKRMNIAMDCGNSVGALVAPRIFKSYSIDLKEIYCDINPDFPNHHPDPTVDNNLVDLIDCVLTNKCDFGVAYDGDADRVVAIDERGNIIRSDILMSIFVNEIINDGDTVVYDVKCSKALDETIKKKCGEPIMWKTGHSHIKNKMIETKSKIGGEMSGHIFFADRYFGFDDGIYVSLRLAELLSFKDVPLSHLVASIPSYYSTPEIRIDCNSDKDKLIITKKMVDYFNDNHQCNLIDGARISFEKGWGLVRSSNTQPVIVCRFEADSKKSLEDIKKIVLDKVKEFGNNDVKF